ncbi:MAG: Hpt domain-containing protein, partial [Thermodesulfobacteriota bacterium]|nr:Hpt domain-containing protein [Thermodesulfobacteriota bacterium]
MVNIKKYKQIFLTDSRAYLQEMNNALVSLEKDLQNLDLIYLLYRKAHSLKGMADTMGYTHIGKLSHALESLLNKFKDGQKEISPLVIDLLFEGVDILEKQVDETASDLPQEVEYDEFLQKIEEVTILEGEVKSIERSIDPIPIRYNKPTTIPVDPELLDNLLSIVGDMIVNQSKLLMQSRDPSLRKMRENVLDSENLIRRLHTEVLQMRMIPLEVLAGAFPRVVRELSKTADKKVDFVVKGGDIKLDRAILDELWDPLVHLIRNALDHGIEPPAERKRKGKDVEGKI